MNLEKAFNCDAFHLPLEDSSMDLIVAGTDDIVCMIEGECLEVPEDTLLDAIEFAIRCYDPCLACSTHAVGRMELDVQVTELFMKHHADAKANQRAIESAVH